MLLLYNAWILSTSKIEKYIWSFVSINIVCKMTIEI